jgi:hypothetical protein
MSKEKELKAKFFFCPKYGKAERCPMVKSASDLQQAHDKAVQALQILDPCEMCEHDFDGKEYSCPCYFKRTQDEALKEITK